MKQLVTAYITALMSVAVLVDDAAARAKVQKPRIVISARPPFYWGLGPGLVSRDAPGVVLLVRAVLVGSPRR
jgi:hypothetical protein